MIVGANTPAVFLTTPMDQSTRSGVAISYTLPGTYDAESDPVTIGLPTTGGLSFVTLTYPNILNISPALTDYGSWSI